MGTIDLGLLPTFVAVAETASFTAAARRLGVPKSTVSRSIASLEASMGVRLVQRSTRKVALSSAGVALLSRVAPHVEALQRAVGEVPERAEEPSGLLRVTASVDFGAAVLAEIVARFVARHPAVEVEMHLTAERVDLVAEGFDLALRHASRRLEDSTLSARSAGPLTIHLYASPSYVARRGAPRAPADLDDHEWVVLHGLRAPRLESATDSVLLKPRGRIKSNDMFFVREALRAGAGIGLLPTYLARADVATGALVRVLPQWTMRTGTLWIVAPAARHAPKKVVAFRDFVLEQLKTRSV